MHHCGRTAARGAGCTHWFLPFLLIALSGILILASPGRASGDDESYPRLANIYFGTLIGADLELFSRWDVLVLPKRSQAWYQEEMATIRALNPDIRFLVHMPIGYCGDWTSPEINGDLVEALNDNGWWMRDTEGQRVLMPFGSWLVNCTLFCPDNAQGQRLCDWLPTFIADNLGPGGCWDGVYLDFCMDHISWANAYVADPIDSNLDGLADSGEALDAAWRGGQHVIVSRLREKVGEDYIIASNGNNTFWGLVNGSTREDFPRMHGGWYQNIMNPGYGYVAIQQRYRSETINIVNSIWRGPVGPNGPLRDDEFERKFAFWLTSVLVYGNGYFSFDGGDGLPAHSQAWWHDLYDVELGQPLDRAESVVAEPGDVPWVELGDMVRLRRFSNGVAVVNPSSYTQTIELGLKYYDLSSWNGEFYPLAGATTTVELVPFSGTVLIGNGRILEVTDSIGEATIDESGVLLEWTTIPDASRYSVYYWLERAGSVSPRTLLDVVDDPVFHDVRTIGRGTHHYQIAPIDANQCEGLPSRPIEVSVVPGSDRTLESKVDGLDGRQDLTWISQGGSAESAVTGITSFAPHPVRDTTTISFGIADDERWASGSPVSITVYDVAGRVVRRLVDGILPSGRHQVEWNGAADGGARVASGCYFCALRVGDETHTAKLLVLN